MRKKTIWIVGALFLLTIFIMEKIAQSFFDKVPDIEELLMKKISQDAIFSSNFGDKMKASNISFDPVKDIDKDTINFEGGILGDKGVILVKGKTLKLNNKWVIIQCDMKLDSTRLN